ncbi:lysM domain-containing GPI-anchored protein 2 [Lactuca sativa]|uniref:lysM domain-containing GPI-anchored protein 2 n=1 Tax=Lactuca sativa TaxID=4236 RepID=UPI001C68F088|nr:lysM domain-containing GPI-anchored protein 2 [Lactuca sativa]
MVFSNIIFFPILFLLCSIFSIHSTAQTQTLGFRCTNTTTCNSLVDYRLPNTTSISSILKLFGVKNLRSFLAANNLPITTPQTQTFPASQILKIPFPCFCRNGVGISDHRPIYTVLPEDGLDHIAADVFSNIVTYPQIQSVNNISDPNNILDGQKLWIPLPCSCDEVDGETVVHYGYMVAVGNTASEIALQFNTTESTLLYLNGMNSSLDLIDDTIIDVPLMPCSRFAHLWYKLQNNSSDYPLIVPNGTYTLTANNCVQCECNAANSRILECKPSTIILPQGQTCPSMQCVGSDFNLGATTFDSNCKHSRCSYAGYTNRTIFTTVTHESTCPSSPSGKLS